MKRHEEVPLVFGEGRISGILSILLGVSALISVLCFHFPEYLTTPELRPLYAPSWLRRLLLGGMLLSVVLGGVSIFLSRSKRLGFTGIAATLLAQDLALPGEVTLNFGVEAAFGFAAVGEDGGLLPFDNDSWTMTVVPEPGTGLLMGLGLASLAGLASLRGGV